LIFFDSLRTAVLRPAKDKLQPALFIIGSGRNGSTLLAMLLNRHENIFLPPEQYALPYSLTDWQISFPKKKWNHYYKKQLEAYLKKNQNWSLTKKDEIYLDEILSNLPKNKQNPVELFNIIFHYYATHIAGKTNITYVGDHSPLTTMFYPYLFYYFSKAHYIFLIRHPFDVVLSYQKLKGNPASIPENACKKWNNSIKAYNYLKSKNHPVLLLKYEELVTNTEEKINEILDFLNIEKQNLLITPSTEENDLLGAKDIPYHKNLYKPINNTSIGKWKDSLDKNIINKITPLVKKNAQIFGYNLKN